MLVRDLAKLPQTQRKAKIAQMVETSQSAPNGQLDGVRLQIRELEEKHGMATAEMVTRFKAGEIADDFEFVEWLMLAQLVRD